MLFTKFCVHKVILKICPITMYPRPIRIYPNSKIGVKIWKKSTSDNLNIERLRDFHNNVPLTKKYIYELSLQTRVQLCFHFETVVYFDRNLISYLKLPHKRPKPHDEATSCHGKHGLYLGKQMQTNSSPILVLS